MTRATTSVESHEPHAEITRLVVGAIYRDAKVGRLLVERGENRARKRGLTAMRVRSNNLREQAHWFRLRAWIPRREVADNLRQGAVGAFGGWDKVREFRVWNLYRGAI